jgi:hypothetical protein
MRRDLKLLTVLAVASVTAAACGDDGTTTTPAADTTAGADTGTGGDTATTGGDTTTGTDTPSTGGDTTTNPCGSRECGTFAGQSCGTCTAPEECNSAGRCEVPGLPMGAFCGSSPDCHPGLTGGFDPDEYPGCTNSLCESETCLTMAGASGAVVSNRDVCSRSCQLYKDSDQDGINDEDAPQDDCNPPDIVDGPAGNKFRCVNFAEPGRNPLGFCVPGTTFKACDSSADCPAGENCELTNAIAGGQNYNTRCVASLRENDAWEGNVIGTAQECSNEGPEDLDFCGDGLCFGFGCVPFCKTNADCDTTRSYPGTGCVEGKCAGTDKACTTDLECSSWTCGEPRRIFGTDPGDPEIEFSICWPGGCSTEDDCGTGFYCRFGWNGEVGDAAGPDNLCFPETPGGADLGEACDPDPDDNVPGATCQNSDYCFGGFCSAICGDDSDCAGERGQKCAMLEFPVDTNDDGEDEALLPFEMCLTFPNSTTSCVSTADCDTTESCEFYTVEGPDADAPHVAAGVCVPNPDNGGEFGDLCQGNEDCNSGFCLGATATSAGFCSKLCDESPECGDVTIDGDSYSGMCRSYLYSRGADLEDTTVWTFISLCVPQFGSLDDCSGDYACDAANEACFPNTVLRDPTVEAKVEYLCGQVYGADETAPTKGVGAACNANADATECASGLCLPTGDEPAGTNPVWPGICTELCTVGEDGNCGNGTTCQEEVRGERRGQYEGNSASFGFCKTAAQP